MRFPSLDASRVTSEILENNFAVAKLDLISILYCLNQTYIWSVLKQSWLFAFFYTVQTCFNHKLFQMQKCCRTRLIGWGLLLHTFFVDDNILFLDCFNGFHPRWAVQHLNMNPADSGVKGRRCSGMLHRWKDWRQNKWKQTWIASSVALLSENLSSTVWDLAENSLRVLLVLWRAKVEDISVD